MQGHHELLEHQLVHCGALPLTGVRILSNSLLIQRESILCNLTTKLICS